MSGRLQVMLIACCLAASACTPHPATEQESPRAPDRAVPNEPEAPSVIPVKPLPGHVEIPSIRLTPSTSDTQPVVALASTSPVAMNQRRAILQAMQPLQIWLGQWKGSTQREFGQFKALDEPSWVWDFRSRRDQPALVMSSSSSPYFRSLRVTYQPEADEYQCETVDPDGRLRTFTGRWEAPVEEFQGDDQQMHKRFKLVFVEQGDESARDQMQLTFNQQDNHRCLIELARRRGSGFLRFDTIATQRAGTSFGKSDAGYGLRECIISGGLGTIEVRHQGRTFYVCCTGCQSAFADDPETWIAEYTQKKQGGEAMQR